MAASILSLACGEMTGPLYMSALRVVKSMRDIHVGAFFETTRDLEVLGSLD
jgi:hypothetical protein